MVNLKWSEICIHTTNEAIEPISYILSEAGASGVVIEDADDFHKERTVELGEIYELNRSDYPIEGVYVKSYLPMNENLNEAVKKIKEAINQLVDFDLDIGQNKITLSEVDEEDWSTAWKKYYKPIRVSDQITITPTWEDYTPESEEEVIIELDPGMAFGTGTHPTTMLSIQAIEAYLEKGQTVVDVGTGSGVLSITAALLGADHVYAYDLDEIAVKSAGMNIKLNKNSEKITVQQNDLLNNVTVQPDLIVANILAEIIMRFETDAFKILKPGGLFITSGIIKAKEADVKEALITAGFEILETNQMQDWILIVAKKPV